MLAIATSSFAAGQADGRNIGDITLDSRLQSVAIPFGADLGFPDGFQAMALGIDCRTGKVLTFPIKNSTDAQQKMLMGLNYVKVKGGMDGELTAPVNSKEQYRFFCKNGVLYWDFSSAEKANFSGLTKASAGITSMDRSLIGDRPMYINVPGPAQMVYRLEINTMNLSRATEIASNMTLGSTDGVSGPKPQAFFLAADGKTLLPFSSRSTFPFPIKTGKGGSVVTIYQTGDYTKAENWHRTVIDFANYTVSNVTLNKPDGLVFGR